MPRARSSRPAALALAALAALASASPAGADPPGADRAVTYRRPVDAEVSDPFRPPVTRYGRGNRGLEYDTAPGEHVRAAAPGTVAFAGQVAGRLHVTVGHPDGVRTTYGPLARIAAGVVRGASVEAGEVIGVAGEALLWTARIGAAYVDPAVLLDASGPVRVRLVPDRPRTVLRRRPLGPR